MRFGAFANEKTVKQDKSTAPFVYNGKEFYAFITFYRGGPCGSGQYTVLTQTYEDAVRVVSRNARANYSNLYIRHIIKKDLDETLQKRVMEIEDKLVALKK